MTYDCLVVGAGFAGSVTAERLASSGKRVLVIDKRNHIGGNAYDYLDLNGIRVHKYGPHSFHTNSLKVVDYLSRFTEWTPSELVVKASVDGKLVPLPPNLNTYEALGIPVHQRSLDPVWTAEDFAISSLGQAMYEKIVKNYTEKQWGRPASELSPTITRRLSPRLDRDDRYFTDWFQAVPKDGYANLFRNLLDHPNIEVALNECYRGRKTSAPIIWTGPVDEFWNYCHGPLPYRSLRFEWKSYASRFQPCAIVTYPNDHAYTRTTEFGHMTGWSEKGSTVCYEYPSDEGEPYYPVPSLGSQETYHKYKRLCDAALGADVHFLGRLGTYRYYNMDQVVAQALAYFDRNIA